MTTSRTMQSLVQMYLEERHSAGFALEIPGKLLMGFAHFSDQRGHRGPITEQLTLDWVQGCAKRATPFTWARRLQTIRPFARFCLRIDRATYIPEQDIFGRAKRRLTPHIYADREITDLLRAAGQLKPEGTLRPATYKTLFGLIAATGLRLSEALKLRFVDLDFVRNLLTIRQTKFAKSRLVPLHPSVTAAVLPLGDVGLERAVRTIYGEVSDIEKLAEGWRPFRSVACWYLWRTLGNRQLG